MNWSIFPLNTEMSGSYTTDDFAYGAFKRQIMAMGGVEDGTFRFADNEADGNLAFLEREGYTHNGTASDEYIYNGLRFFWNGEK